MNRQILFSLLALTMSACQSNTPQLSQTCEIMLTVLGNAQDAGKPQIGRHDDTAWREPAHTAPATSLGLSIKSTGERFLFDATPDIKAQLYAFDMLTDQSSFRLDGVFLTHAHMGHYLGLAQMGREAMGAKNVSVYAMPRMKSFLENNGPWDLLVRLGNIDITELANEIPIQLTEDLAVTPFLVPHREEYSETVGYRISNHQMSAVYLPDVDNWDEWAAKDDGAAEIADVVRSTNYLFLDATFFSGDELPGRDMSQIPHPTMQTTMARFTDYPDDETNKIIFIHMNHTNPALNRESPETKLVLESGFNIARTGQQFCLD